MYEPPMRDPDTQDGLFLERLETFMDKCLVDIKAFAEREFRPYEETRRCIAEWHAKYLFQPSLTAPTDEFQTPNKQERVRSVLLGASQTLESLHAVTGTQAFVLAINPNDESDQGFLGGSIVGREFWRGLRSGGENGAKMFKLYCQKKLSPTTIRNCGEEQAVVASQSITTSKQGPAKALKNELYDQVRNALRAASGIRSAEMRWTNLERLDVYGVRLVGWPPEVPAQNPSTLKASQNKQLLDALRNGTMKFERTMAPAVVDAEVDSAASSDQAALNMPEADTIEMDDFSWAYDADGEVPTLPDLIPRNPSSLSTGTRNTLQTSSSSSPPESSSNTRPKKRLRSKDLDPDFG